MSNFPVIFGTPILVPQIGATQKLSIGATSANVQLAANAVYRLFSDSLCYVRQGSDNTVTASDNDCPVNGYSEIYIHTHGGNNWLAYITSGVGNLWITRVA